MKKLLALMFLSGLILVTSCHVKKEVQSQSQPTSDPVHRTDSVVNTSSAQKVDSVVPAKVVAPVEVVAPIEVVVQKDTTLDHLARFVAGLPQLKENSFSALEKDSSWIDFKKNMDENWKKMHDERLANMQQWERDVFSKSVNDSLKLFYPFSGPDFLHANVLYPRSKEYIMFGLEPVREVTNLLNTSAQDRDRFLDSLGSSLRDIFAKSYFITNHMMRNLSQVKGVMPLFYFFMERSGYELLQQKFITIDTVGNQVEVPGRIINQYKTQGVSVVIRHVETGRVKKIFYFSVNVTNDGLKIRKGFSEFIHQRAPFNTFVKSASYIMHDGKQFSTIRSLVLDNAVSVFQDDTGIPYYFFEKKPEWNATFYGEYIAPVEDFSRGLYQATLDSAFRRKSQPLPFSLGYHWSTRKQNYMFFGKASVAANK